MKSFIGIDIGSLASKVVLISEGKLVDYRVERSTFDFKRVGNNLFNDILEKNNLNKESVFIMSTGYGRNTIDIADDGITEITAHARGVQYFYPEVTSVIDIGGQDSKAILISKKTGNVMDFQMNDKCAAGTGRFLEVMAHALEVPIEEIGKLALNSNKPSSISSTCTVFAESEVISLIAKKVKKEDIIAGLHKSIGKRIAELGKTAGIRPIVFFDGGGAKNTALHKAIERELGYEIYIPDQPQIIVALGAALIAHEKSERKKVKVSNHFIY